MLTTKARNRLTAVGCVLLILFVLVGFSYFLPLYGEICSKNEYTGQKECSGYHLVTVALWHFFKALDAASVAVTALATGAIAIFTYILYRATDRQARLTREAIRNADESSRRELRAYLGIDAGAATIRGHQVEFWVNVRNRGQTPAYDVSRVARADTIDPGATGVSDFSLPPQAEGRWMIVPGAFWTVRAFRNLIDVEESQFDESLGTFFWGRIEYTDTFGDAHWMTFRYRVDIETVNTLGARVGWELDVTEDGNDADRES